jgi:hypothetical protein
MKFSQKGNLDKHMQMIHVGKIKYTCAHCDKPFSKKYNLLVHLNNNLNKYNNMGSPETQSSETKFMLQLIKRNIEEIELSKFKPKNKERTPSINIKTLTLIEPNNQFKFKLFDQNEIDK